MKINFVPHPVVPNGIQAIVPLEDGYSLSIVGGPSLYGDGVNDFEIAVFDKDNNMMDLPNGDQVQGYVTMDQILEFIESDYASQVMGPKRSYL